MRRWSFGIVVALMMLMSLTQASLANAQASFTAAITYPAVGQNVGGSQTIGTSTTAPWGTAKTFALSVDGTPIATQSMATGSTFWIIWNTTGVPDGPRTLTLKVTANGQTATTTRAVTVTNGATTPAPLAASFASPAASATVSGTTTVGMAVTGGSGTTTFTLALGTTVLSTQTVAGTSASHAWNTTAVANGSQTLTLTAVNGGRTATTTRTVTVANGTATPAPLAASFTSPAAAATVAGTATVGMAASGASGTTTFRLALGATVLATQTVTGSTASYAWNTASVANGTHTLTLTVTSGTQTATATRTVTVSNSTSAASFTAAFTYPGAGATVSGSQSVGMSTTAPWGTAKTFTLSVDGATIATRSMATGSTLWIIWNSATVTNGSRTLTLSVTAGGQTATTSRAVTVANGTTAPPPAPAPLSTTFTSPAAGATLSGMAQVGVAVSSGTAPITFNLTVASAVPAELSTQTVSATTATYAWDTSSVHDGTHTLTVTATDGAGKTATASRTVTVRNTQAPPPTGGGMGPLRVLASNPRYFTDGTGRAVYLTGSHNWESLVDRDIVYPPAPFDYTGYLDWMVARGHNFMRMWAWEPSRHHRTGGVHGTGTLYFNAPSPYMRTGPGSALDGRPKWDLTNLNQAYFDRLRARVIQARERGIYVSVMLFEGFAVQFATQVVHPFDDANNVNGINGDPNNDGKATEVHTLASPAITAIQKAYVRKVIDTVNDLDNVLYEIMNESGSYSTSFQYAMINYVKQYQATKPQQHVVGMTYQYSGGTNSTLFASPADWISPGDLDGYKFSPPPASGQKVIISDTDHLGGSSSGLGRAWVWKSFTRGIHTIYMDRLDNDATVEDARRAMGYSLDYANRMNLAAMTPQPSLCSTGYCLAGTAGADDEYLVYLPSGGTVSVNLAGASGTLAYEWFRPSTGTVVSRGTTTGGASRSFTAPFTGDAVLYIGNR